MLFDKLDTVKMRVLQTSNVSCRRDVELNFGLYSSNVVADTEIVKGGAAAEDNESVSSSCTKRTISRTIRVPS